MFLTTSCGNSIRRSTSSPDVRSLRDRALPETPVFWRHREIVQRIEAMDREPLEPMWADVTVLQLVADVVQMAFAAHGLPPTTPQRHRCRSCRTRRSGEDISRIAAGRTDRPRRRGAGCARVSLSSRSVFRQRTGVPIHRYLTRLRLRASLERLADAPTISRHWPSIWLFEP